MTSLNDRATSRRNNARTSTSTQPPVVRRLVGCLDSFSIVASRSTSFLPRSFWRFQFSNSKPRKGPRARFAVVVSEKRGGVVVSFRFRHATGALASASTCGAFAVADVVTSRRRDKNDKKRKTFWSIYLIKTALSVTCPVTKKSVRRLPCTHHAPPVACV